MSLLRALQLQWSRAGEILFTVGQLLFFVKEILSPLGGCFPWNGDVSPLKGCFSLLEAILYFILFPFGKPFSSMQDVFFVKGRFQLVSQSASPILLGTNGELQRQPSGSSGWNVGEGLDRDEYE